MSEEALKWLLEYRTELLGFIYLRVRDSHAAEDVFQSVALAIVRKAEIAKPIANFRAWIKEMARREVLYYLRSPATRRLNPLPSAEMLRVTDEVYLGQDPSPKELVEEFAALRSCLEKLPGKLRELVKQRYLDGRGYREMAEQFRQSEVAVRQSVSRGRRALMDCVQGALGMA